MESAVGRNDPVKHAVVLSGGGAFGAFEIGVLRALVNGKSPSTGNEPLEPEIFTGTSVGAYNAAVLASKGDLNAQASVAYLEDLWLNRIAGGLGDNGVLRVRGNLTEVMDPREVIRRQLRPVFEAMSDAAYLSLEAGRRLAYFIRSKQPLMHRTMEMFDFGSIISTEPLQSLVRDTVPFEELHRSAKILKIAATNWITGDLRVFVHDPAKGDTEWQEGEEEGLTKDTWPHALMASTAIPGTFPAVKIEGTPYVDGGVVMNTPLKSAITAGASVIHLICLNPDASSIPLDDGPPCTLGTFERLLSLVVSAAVDDDVATAHLINNLLDSSPHRKNGAGYREVTVHRYNPEISLGGMTGILDFREKCLRNRMDAGEKTAIDHDCAMEGCVIPGKPHQKRVVHRRKYSQSN